ncbi:MAG: ABC transporter ATP-binding protein [Treponema sp.]|nr:ABC transporter ATP-binding protein [Treponema sp.]
MANNNIAIKVENLSKYYRLGVINNGTLFKDIQSWAARKRGKEDPHAKLESRYDPTEEGFWALKDLNFEIKKGDRVGIIGHNGAGKSTLLKILSQITAPTEGTLKINGKISSLLEVGTGFHAELTGRENIFMNGAILGMKHAEIDSRINDIIEFSEIGGYIDTPVKRYSSGMYVRLAFAVAAHLNSDILIADEVLAVGDAAFQKKALGKMNDLSTGEGRTVLFVSHNMAQVKALCNKGMVLEKGQFIYNGGINDAISLYLDNKGYKNNSDYIRYEKNSESSETEFLDVFDYSVVNEKGQLLEKTFHLDGKVFIEINGDVKKTDNNLLLFVCILDKFDNPLWTNEVYNFKPGKFHLKMELPLNYLLDGIYKICVYAIVHYKKYDISGSENSISFSFFKTHEQHPIYTEENYPLTGTIRNELLDIAMPFEIEQ